MEPCKGCKGTESYTKSFNEADLEYVGESISDDGVRITHKRVKMADGDVPCMKCMRIRRWLLRGAFILSGAIAIHFISPFVSPWFGG